MAGPLKRLFFSFDLFPQKAEGEAEEKWLRPFLNLAQYLKETVQRVNDTPWTTSRTVSVTFTGGDTLSLAHGLQRVPVRWVVEDVTGSVGAFERISWDATFITIYSDNACTVVLRVE